MARSRGAIRATGEDMGGRAGLDAAAAERICQEVFLSVHRSIRRFDPTVEGATFRGWLWRITRNAVPHSLRKPRPDARGGSTANARMNDVSGPVDESLLIDDPPSSPDDTAALLHRAMRQIESRVDPTTWQAFIRTTVDGEKAVDGCRQIAGYITRPSLSSVQGYCFKTNSLNISQQVIIWPLHCYPGTFIPAAPATIERNVFWPVSTRISEIVTRWSASSP